MTNKADMSYTTIAFSELDATEPYQVRATGTQVDARILEALRANGGRLTDPVTVAKQGKGYAILDGHGRVAALVQLAIEALPDAKKDDDAARAAAIAGVRVPAIVVPHEGVTAALMSAIAYQSARRELTPWERVIAVARVRSAAHKEGRKIKQADVAIACGISQPFVSWCKGVTDVLPLDMLKEGTAIEKSGKTLQTRTIDRVVQWHQWCEKHDPKALAVTPAEAWRIGAAWAGPPPEAAQRDAGDKPEEGAQPEATIAVKRAWANELWDMIAAALHAQETGKWEDAKLYAIAEHARGFAPPSARMLKSTGASWAREVALTGSHVAQGAPKAPKKGKPAATPKTREKGAQGAKKGAAK